VGPVTDKKAIDAVVYKILEKYRGSVSAEHGIGLSKKPYIHLSRSDAELAVMRSIKAALDPKGILNPGKIIG
jgi:FAD/FMN-containing dehydrogenase